MLKLDNRRANKIDSIFVIAIFTVFAFTAFLLILIGAKQYKHTAATMDSNYETRTISSYLIEKVRQNDNSSAITTCELEGIPALAFKDTENDVTYITYIYYYEDALREIMVTADSVFSLSSGQKIIKTAGFYPEFLDSDLLKITISTLDGNTKDLYLTLHSDTRKEQP